MRPWTSSNEDDWERELRWQQLQRGWFEPSPYARVIYLRRAVIALVALNIVSLCAIVVLASRL